MDDSERRQKDREGGIRKREKEGSDSGQEARYGRIRRRNEKEDKKIEMGELERRRNEREDKKIETGELERRRNEREDKKIETGELERRRNEREDKKTETGELERRRNERKDKKILTGESEGGMREKTGRKEGMQMETHGVDVVGRGLQSRLVVVAVRAGQQVLASLHCGGIPALVLHVVLGGALACDVHLCTGTGYHVKVNGFGPLSIFGVFWVFFKSQKTCRFSCFS